MRVRSTVPSITIVVSSLLIAPQAFAHHSFAPHFDSSKPANISGTVTQYEARNPHSYLHIAAVDENGRTREYVCESHGVTQLTRNGIKPEMFKAGTKVRVTGSMSRHSPYMCFFDNVEFEDGRTLNVNGPRGASPATAAPTVAKRKDLFGTWLLAPIPNRSTSGPQPMIELMNLARIAPMVSNLRGDFMIGNGFGKARRLCFVNGSCWTPHRAPDAAGVPIYPAARDWIG